MQNLNDYRVGDKVLIAPKEFLEEKGINFPHALLDGTDRVVSLIEFERASGWHCERRIGAVTIWIPEAAILGHAFKWNEKIQVSDLADSWDVRFFRNYLCGCGHPFQASICPQPGYNVATYRYARPIRKEEENPASRRLSGGELAHSEPYSVYSLPEEFHSIGCKYATWDALARKVNDSMPWIFVGFYRTNVGPDSLPGKGSPTPFYHGLGGEILVKPFAKFVRREKP